MSKGLSTQQGATTANQINILHSELIGMLTKSLHKAAEIGRLLTEKKGELRHGEFTNWIRDNLTFTDRTARNYIRLFDNREKIAGATTISDAYKMLQPPKTETVSDLITDIFFSGIDRRSKVWTAIDQFPEIAAKIEFTSSGLNFKEDVTEKEWLIIGRCLSMVEK